MPIELNPLETARFGVIAARVIDPTAGPDEIDAAAGRAGVALLTARIPVPELARVQAFEAAGYRLMDTLLYYGRTLEDLPNQPSLTEGIRCRLATPADAGPVAEVSRHAFAGYIGHYHADPRLDPAAADAAYVEWAETSTVGCSPEAPVLVAETGAGVIGFLTLRQNGTDEMEIVLNAVAPAFHGRGVYAALVVEAMALARSRGSSRVITSTQINNYAVQRVWSRLGFFHVRSLYTFHKWFR